MECSSCEVGKALRRKPVRIDGINAKQKIKQTTEKLFAENSYDNVSVSMIARKADVSNGAVYQYYANKDEILREIIEDTLYLLKREVKTSSIEDFVESYYEFYKNHQDKLRVLYEAQYSVDWVSEECNKCISEFQKELNLDIVGTIFLIHSLRFIIDFLHLFDVEFSVKDFVSIVNNGFLSAREIITDSEIINKAFESVSTKSHFVEIDSNKDKILSSAEKLFGKYGYKNVKVYEITQSAGLGVGTFYLYFKTKEEILRELVDWINKGLRYNVRLSIEQAIEKFEILRKNRIAQEVIGIYGFVKFFESHRKMYKIVRESEFVNVEIPKNYYTKIYTPYLKIIEELKSQNYYRKGLNTQLSALFLMSLGHTIGDMYLIRESVDINQVKEILTKLYEYLSAGMLEVE